MMIEASIYPREHMTWRKMLERCYDTTRVRFDCHGGRGIRVCGRWRGSFSSFILDLGRKPDGYTIERIDNDGHYSCGKCEECKKNGWVANCRWATRYEQSRNKRNNVIIEWSGKRQCLTDWAAETGLNIPTLWKRLFLHKWSVEDALTKPKQKPKDYIHKLKRQRISQAFVNDVHHLRQAGMSQQKIADKLGKTKKQIRRALRYESSDF